MPTRQHPLEAGGPPRITLTWGAFWKDMRVRLDDRELGTIPDGKALKAGRDFPLGDGTTLHVRLEQGFGNAGLRVERDGVPLPGTSGDPAERLKLAYGLVYFVAGLNAALGLVAELASIDVLLSIGIGWGTIVTGAIYALLGWFVHKRRSKVALGLAIVLFALDGLLTLAFSVDAGGTPPVGGLVVRVFFIVQMARGFGAIQELKASKAA